MRCSDLRDIADSWLSDDALITSNHEALGHIECCDDCLREIVDRRNLRIMLRTAIMEAPASQMDEEFASRLRARLRAVTS
jgi:vacuolar-type H+-ATPase subunit C/Vma6